MQYGFVINHETCIGCHACTVACKAENDVPVGDFRTSVKYVERGTFPEIRRHFLVQRCNHCTDAPCVTICPVSALEKRPDGIVDLDRDACIGCRACMQACPYDALYLNDDKGAVEKCHFCAHRVDQGLEPACVNVCPTGSIVTGDMNDPSSRVSLLIEGNETQVRAPEQATSPNVHYIGADEVALQPGAAARPSTYIFSDRPPHKPEDWPEALPLVPDARVVLDSGHRVEWGWHVAAYLVTKGIAAGAGMLAPFAAWLGLGSDGAAGFVPELVALVFVLATCVLLVDDLSRPLTFLRMVTRPNFKSWLVRGGIVLTAFIGISAAALAARLAGEPLIADLLRWVNLPVAALVAGYTAFLFAQCKGRDLWEGKLLLPHLLVQALLAGGACVLLIDPSSIVLRGIVFAAAVAHGFFALHDWRGPHATANARQAAAFLPAIRFGPLRAMRDGLILAVVVGGAALWFLPALAFVPVLAGLYLWEHAYVRAGQLPPLS